MRVVRGGPEVSEASRMAMTLVVRGAPEAEIIEQLKAVPGGAKTLRKAARLYEGRDGFPTDRCRELLIAAAEGSPVPDVSAVQKADDDEQRRLYALPLAEGFATLAQRVPALRGLEQRARDGGLEPHPGMASRIAARTGDPAMLRAASVMTLMKEARLLVGPKSNSADRLVAAPLAESVVRRHLADVAGVLPPNGV